VQDILGNAFEEVTETNSEQTTDSLDLVHLYCIGLTEGGRVL